MRAVYTVNPTGDRRISVSSLEAKLDKWYLDLPSSLRWDYSPQSCPSPHVTLLHMEFWCSVLLLHRPLYDIFLIRFA